MEPHQRQPAGTSWDPSQYERFQDHRLRPALELLARVPSAAPHTVIDLGCGTGNVTRILAKRWPDAHIVGVDHSAEMLTAARENQGNDPNATEWLEQDIESWSPAAPVDVIYANASLHWVPDHESLFQRLLASLQPGGCLAVQMPLSFDLPSHRLMRETLEDFGTAELRAAVGRRWVEEMDRYYDVLIQDASTLDIWATEYLQELEGEDAVLDWVRGTGLRPVLNGLPPEELEPYLDRYRGRLRAAYPRRSDGTTLYPFQRLFLVATTAVDD